MNPATFLRQISAHTSIASPTDALAYRRGRIDITMQLSSERQTDFELRADGLRSRLESCIKAAQADYDKELRMLFVEFGQIAKEPVVELTRVVSKLDREATE